jgi:hypothetical protein
MNIQKICPASVSPACFEPKEAPQPKLSRIDFTAN